MTSPLSLDVGYFFGEFQCLPVDDCLAVSCDSGALAKGSPDSVLALKGLTTHVQLPVDGFIFPYIEKTLKKSINS